ncbi:hypothetical protein [Nostoc sp. DSM 114167]|jgi:hypothetical protein|uniref:hypothetical protein n=1 Tax=Nostoc sp. DSM 114167 TaxID=3439050 RepID=UPI00404599FE
MNSWQQSDIDLVKRCTSEKLISLEAWQKIEQLVPKLPPFSTFILECRLVADNPQVDFSMCMQQKLPDRTDIFNHPLWQRIQNFYEQWLNPTSPLHDILIAGPEFDLEGVLPDPPIPSFFLPYTKN